MSYPDLIQRLFQVNLMGGSKLGLQNCLQLQTLLHYPDQAYHSIHVAGTNGKGSVVTKIASALQEAGYRVGLYTSPHISCFRERIRLNGQMIPEEAVEELLSSLFSLTERYSIPATFFELTTFLALSYFAKEQVDFAVLETGLGGRLDATNIVNPILSIITSISLDHTEILGTSKEAIAEEKAGIIKPGVPVILGPQTPHEFISQIAYKQQSPCLIVQEHSSVFEEENQAIAKLALNYLSSRFTLTSANIEKGLLARQPCRFEVIPGSPLVILDVAHNPDGLIHLFEACHKHYPSRPLRILFGLSKSKDIEGCIDILKANGQDFHLVEAINGRGVPVTDLYQHLIHAQVSPSCLSIHSNIPDAILEARDKAGFHGQALVVCGSFFIMSEVRKALGFQESCDAYDLNERSATSSSAI